MQCPVRAGTVITLQQSGVIRYQRGRITVLDRVGLEATSCECYERIRTAYRQMMRKYHPDMHAGNPQKQKAATELSMRVTAAYNGLVAHLEKK